jgi:signal transduction histidine kinase
LKHSDCKEIFLETQINGRTLEMRLKDDGKGFDKENTSSSGNGLENMKRRAKIIRGNLNIYSLPQKGTIVQFTGQIP